MRGVFSEDQQVGSNLRTIRGSRRLQSTVFSFDQSTIALLHIFLARYRVALSPTRQKFFRRRDENVTYH